MYTRWSKKAPCAVFDLIFCN